LITTIQYNSRKLQIDLLKPLDISMPIRASKKNVNAWYIDEPKIEPVRDGEWIAAVSEGADVNFNTISFNPHAHGTHTECVGHITERVHSINQNLKTFFFLAEVITVAPENDNEDKVISKKQIQFALGNKKRDAVILRTIPNTRDKLSRQYSHTNWPYLKEDAVKFLVNKGVKHLLIDGEYFLNLQIAPFENDASPSKPILYKVIS